MKVKTLIQILERCNEEDEVGFIFDSNEKLSRDRGYGLYESVSR